jgi:ribonuclease T2
MCSLLFSTVLPVLLSGLPASAYSPFYALTNATSCAKAATQVSCQSTYAIDPTSFATCCYNGALQPGEKESGLVLATQFYDTNPSTGPKNSTTIHGLWPDYCDGTYPAYCTNDSGIPTMTGAQIQALIQEYNPALLEYMNVYYKDVNGDDPTFWEHEVRVEEEGLS